MCYPNMNMCKNVFHNIIKLMLSYNLVCCDSKLYKTDATEEVKYPTEIAGGMQPHL